jgi:pimeloyl-ACP methyl ester carboxylesterase
MPDSALALRPREAFGQKPAAASRAPVVFGASPQRCAGWLHGIGGAIGVVICAPLGAEEECAHRSLLHLADGLADRGFPTLRFDFPATGDSEGESPDHAGLEDWVHAAAWAAGFLREQVGCTQVALIGLRLGAAVAGMAAARADARWLVLWAPVSNGRAYARELRAVAALGSGHGGGEDTALGVAGHLLANSFVDALATVGAQAWDLGGVRRALLLERDDVAPDSKLRDSLRDSGVELDLLTFGGYAAMFDRPHDSEVPWTALADVCEWMAGRADDSPVPLCVQGLSSPDRDFHTGVAELRTADYTEQRLMLGTGRRMPSVLCEPAGDRVVAPLVLLLNAGAVHHAGPGRLYVRLARELARSGVPSLRVDLSMLGDGIVAGVPDENDCYAPACQHDVMDLLGEVQDRLGFRDLVLGGLCSGAFWALQGAVDPAARGLRAVAMINPLVIGRRPHGGRSLGLEAAEALRYRRSMRSWAKWKKVFALQVDLRAAIQALAGRALSVLQSALRELSRRLGLAAPNAIGQGLRRLRAEQVAVGLFVGSSEPGYLLLRQESPREVAAGQRASAIQVFVLEDCDHTFTDEAAKQRLFRAFVAFVQTLRTR